MHLLQCIQDQLQVMVVLLVGWRVYDNLIQEDMPLPHLPTILYSPSPLPYSLPYLSFSLTHSKPLCIISYFPILSLIFPLILTHSLFPL